MEIIFKTQKGSKVTLIKTKTDLELHVNDAQQLGGALNVVSNKDHGKCIKQNFGNLIIPIPLDLVDNIESMINNHKKEVEDRLKSSIKADKEYIEHRNAVCKMTDVGF